MGLVAVLIMENKRWLQSLTSLHFFAKMHLTGQNAPFLLQELKIIAP
jgi:hypothetical protein